MNTTSVQTRLSFAYARPASNSVYTSEVGNIFSQKPKTTCIYIYMNIYIYIHMCIHEYHICIYIYINIYIYSYILVGSCEVETAMVASHVALAPAAPEKEVLLQHNKRQSHTSIYIYIYVYIYIYRCTYICIYYYVQRELGNSDSSVFLHLPSLPSPAQPLPSLCLAPAQLAPAQLALAPAQLVPAQLLPSSCLAPAVFCRLSAFLCKCFAVFQDFLQMFFRILQFAYSFVADFCILLYYL